MLRRTNDVELPGASMVAVPARESGRLLMPARRGKSSKVVVYLRDCSVVSVSTSARSNQTSFTHRWKLERASGTGGEEQTAWRAGSSESQSIAVGVTITVRRCHSAASPTPTPLDPKKPGVWRSDDKGKTWRIVSNENNRPMYYSQIRVDPKNPENVFVGGLNFSRSTDGGKTFKSLQPGIAHSDHHAAWIDPNNGNHLWIGNDGGLDVTLRSRRHWEFVNTIPAAQFYADRR